MAIERRPAGFLLLNGIVGGIVAGIVFASFEMIVAVAMGGNFFDPLRMIGAMVLGSAAMEPTFPLATAAMAGVLVHMLLSAIYGVVFFYLLTFARQLCSPAWLLLGYGAVFGLLLWIVNFMAIAPVAFPQFLMADPFWMGFVAHTFLFGTVLGAYTVAARYGWIGSLDLGYRVCPARA